MAECHCKALHMLELITKLHESQRRYDDMSRSIKIQDVISRGRMPVSDLFSKFKKTLEAGVDVIGSKSKELWDTTVIRTRISDLKSRRRSLAEALGVLVFNMIRDNSLDLDQIRAKASDIASVDAEIDRAEAELEQVREQARMQDAAIVEPEDVSTSEVQDEHDDEEHPVEPAEKDEPEPPEEPVRAQAAAPRQCECGADIVQDARFCVWCGRPIPPSSTHPFE